MCVCHFEMAYGPKVLNLKRVLPDAVFEMQGRDIIFRYGVGKCRHVFVVVVHEVFVGDVEALQDESVDVFESGEIANVENGQLEAVVVGPATALSSNVRNDGKLGEFWPWFAFGLF